MNVNDLMKNVPYWRERGVVDRAPLPGHEVQPSSNAGSYSPDVLAELHEALRERAHAGAGLGAAW